MAKQPAIPCLRDAMKKKVTRREQFLAEMEAVVPGSRLLALTANVHYSQIWDELPPPRTRRSTGSSRWCGRGSNTRFACSSASSAI